VNFGIFPNPNQSRYLDPFSDPKWNLISHWFGIRLLCVSTSVSETIRKQPLAEVQTTVGKMRSMERRYLFHCRNYVEKLLLRAKFH